MSAEPAQQPGQQVELSGIHPFQEVIDQRMEYASTIVADGFNSGRITRAALYGIMGGAKTTTVAEMVTLLQYGATVIKKRGDNRGGTDDTSVWVRGGRSINGDGAVIALDSYSQITEVIRSGRFPPRHVLPIIEAQFFEGDESDVREMERAAEERQIRLLEDCLGAWYTATPITQTQWFVDSAQLVIPMQGWDAFDGTQGGATLRVVGLTLDGKQVIHEDGEHYAKKSVEERLIIIGALLTSRFGERLLMRNPDGYPDMDICIGVPSHLEANPVAYGADRYFPVSFKNWQEIYQLAQMDPMINGARSIQDMYPEANVLNWEQLGM